MSASTLSVLPMSFVTCLLYLCLVHIFCDSSFFCTLSALSTFAILMLGYPPLCLHLLYQCLYHLLYQRLYLYLRLCLCLPCPFCLYCLWLICCACALSAFLWLFCCLWLVHSVCICCAYAKLSDALFASAMLMPALSALSTSISTSASTFASISTSAYAIHYKSQPSVFTSNKELINLALYLSWLYYPIEPPLHHPSLWPW